MAAETPEFVALVAACNTFLTRAAAYINSADGYITGNKDRDEALVRSSIAALPALIVDADEAVENLEVG